jgi:hypothetical protein
MGFALFLPQRLTEAAVTIGRPAAEAGLGRRSQCKYSSLINDSSERAISKVNPIHSITLTRRLPQRQGTSKLLLLHADVLLQDLGVLDDRIGRGQLQRLLE